MKLKGFAEILSGYPFRSRIEYTPDGNVSVIQIGDLDMLVPEKLMRVRDIEPKQHYFVRQGDVLLVARGIQHRAVWISSHLPQTVAVSNFFLLRIYKEEVLPAYLTWYLNSQPAQYFFQRHRMGSNILSLQKRDLEYLEVPIPSVGIQERIGHVYNLMLREKVLIATVQEQRERLLEAQMLRMVNEMSNIADF